MDLGSAARVLVRRWIVLVVGLVLTLGLTAYLYTQSPPRYQATANIILLLPPNARGADGSGNPFIYLPSGLQTLADIVVSGVGSREQRQALISRGLTSQFELGVDVQAPIITVSVEGLDPENVMATRDGVIENLEDELATVQREEDTPTRQIAHGRVYDIEDTPDLLAGNRTRGLLMALGVGGLITLMAAFVIDRGMLLYREWARRRAGRPRRDASSVESDGVDAPVASEQTVAAEQGADDDEIKTSSGPTPAQDRPETESIESNGADATVFSEAEAGDDATGPTPAEVGPETERSGQSTVDGAQSEALCEQSAEDNGTSDTDQRPSRSDQSDEQPTAYERV